ncbi:Gfo/Idh/MocA family protein [Aspergillus clavatus NRRL 1]|uniref:Quinate utilisation oxidoreductase QutH n=1 Tax=Aspergillus clavatus (strain ATCC 1007 / CBS 513.65 / DSM 816 / NCTC 3887 / NRRL 1 / QM 1276 / 107) TaxID=344612 RepID=A1CPX1_ASPCL|nr:quinate utilization oxidoreductase QutH [Aspergillus clavatus NRRL 1]EAW07692.1 quinate utilisation oxidoreductase QutH [Aspergillus clavatus NRRL 1]
MSLRVIVVGAGLIGPRHAQSVISNPSTELVALIDPAPSAATVAAQLQTTHFPSIASMLEAIPKPDAAIVCTPNHTHVPVTQELLASGIHVLVEKPVSESIESGHALLAFAKRPEHAHLKLLVGHHRRFNPYVLKTKQILDSGALGTPIAINGLWTLFKPDSYFAAPGDWRRARASGGVIPINLVHDIDLLHHLFGPIERIHAEKTRPQRPRPPHEAEEGAALTLRFASGVVGSFLVCDATPSPHNFETGTGENPLIPPTPGGAGADFYRIFGSQASLSVPDMTRWSYDGRAEKSWNQPLVAEKFEVEVGAKPFDLQLAHFVDVIRGKAEPSCSGEDGLRALIVCQAARKALETGETVDLDADLFGTD